MKERKSERTQTLQMAERGIRASVLRLPMCVYGQGGSYFVPMLLHTAREKGASYFIEPGDSRQATVHMEDLANLYLLALQKAPAGSVYNATLEPNIVARDLAQNTDLPLKPLPYTEAMPILGPILTIVLTLNNNTSGAKAERELGWRNKSPVTFLADIARGSYKA